MRVKILWVLSALLLSSCGGALDSMKSGFAHSQEVAADLEKSVGSKPQVGFNWANGSLVQVTVNFGGVPGKPLGQIVQLSKDSVATRFQQKPRAVVVAFSVPGE
jgi:hypothetical protein